VSRKWGCAALRRAMMRSTTVAVLAGAAFAIGAPSEARAGTYKIWNCNPPGHTGQPIGSWKFDAAANVTGFNACAGGGGFGFQVPGTSPWAYAGSTSSVYVARPAARSAVGILRLKLWFSSWLGGSGAPAFINSGVVGIASPPGGDYSVLPWTGPLFATDNDFVDLRLFCSTGGNGSDCHFSQTRVLEVLGSEIELYEAVAPEAEIVGGTLLSAEAQRDTRQLTFRAVDDDSGVARVEARLDGRIVGVRDFTTDAQHCGFADFHACSPTEAGELNVDTRGLADGSYTLELRTVDAAGNVAIAQAPSKIQIKNAIDEPAGDKLVPVSPAPAPSPPAAKDDAKDNGTSAPVVVHLTARAGAQRTVRVAYGKRIAVRGKLTDEAGRPLGNTDLHVLVQNRMAAASLADKGTLRTRPDGTFVYITPIGPSRMIRFAYRAVEGAREYAATTEVTLLVRASAKLRATPKRVRNGRSVRFTGRLRGTPFPTTGKLVDLQAKVGSKWRTFQVVRADRNGRFAYRYRFTRTFQPLNYRFRARIRLETSYPYQTGSSNQVRVQVRP
jgi:hypothetical protein